MEQFLAIWLDNVAERAIATVAPSFFCVGQCERFRRCVGADDRATCAISSKSSHVMSST